MALIAKFAVYYIPPADSLLYRRGSEILGYDVRQGVFLPEENPTRAVLTEPLHFAFHGNRLTPTQALKELVQLVQVVARQRGRPFNNVLELLPNLDREDDGCSWRCLGKYQGGEGVT